MPFPTHRLRRLRKHPALRDLVRENHLRLEDLVFPVFVTPWGQQPQEVPSMPGVYHYPLAALEEAARSWRDLGLKAIILFGLPEEKDEQGSSAAHPEGAVPRAVQTLKEKYPELLVFTDVCLCQYTSHGHCGIIKGNQVDNDATLGMLADTALTHARAGADVVAPSDMMDGRVGAIRRALDEHGYQDVAILSYAAKYASAFYGPFRDAAHSAPQFGDRRAYQMDPANGREALQEIAQDREEGADMVMVKPGLAFLDVVARAREQVDCPLAAYNVSGEYSMIKAAADRGWVDERRVVLEALTGMKRAGADLILTYFAPQVARWLQDED